MFELYEPEHQAYVSLLLLSFCRLISYNVNGNVTKFSQFGQSHGSQNCQVGWFSVRSCFDSRDGIRVEFQYHLKDDLLLVASKKTSGEIKICRTQCQFYACVFSNIFLSGYPQNHLHIKALRLFPRDFYCQCGLFS